MKSQNSEKRLAGQVAVITGGGSGIGKETALLCAKQGASVVVNDLREEKAQEVVDAIKAMGGSAAAVAGSIAKLEIAEALIDAAKRQFGRLDILFNCAGLGIRVAVDEMTEKQWDLVVDVNLKGSFATIHYATPIFRAQKSGVVINVASEAGHGANQMTNYSAAKEGVVGLTRAVAFELAPYNVRCNAIRPRAFDTGLAAKAHYEKYLAFEEKFGRVPWGQHPISHTIFPRAAEVAAVVAWLCTDDAKDVTGRNFLVGGGEIALMPEPVAMRSCFNPDGWTFESLPRIRKYLFGNLHNPAAGFPAIEHAEMVKGQD